MVRMTCRNDADHGVRRTVADGHIADKNGLMLMMMVELYWRCKDAYACAWTVIDGVTYCPCTCSGCTELRKGRMI